MRPAEGEILTPTKILEESLGSYHRIFWCGPIYLRMSDWLDQKAAEQALRGYLVKPSEDHRCARYTSCMPVLRHAAERLATRCNQANVRGDCNETIETTGVSIKETTEQAGRSTEGAVIEGSLEVLAGGYRK